MADRWMWDVALLGSVNIGPGLETACLPVAACLPMCPAMALSLPLLPGRQVGEELSSYKSLCSLLKIGTFLPLPRAGVGNSP